MKTMTDEAVFEEVRHVTVPGGHVQFRMNVRGGAPWLAEFQTDSARLQSAGVLAYLLDFLPAYQLSFPGEWTTAGEGSGSTTFAPIHFRGRNLGSNTLNAPAEQPAALH